MSKRISTDLKHLLNKMVEETSLVLLEISVCYVYAVGNSEQDVLFNASRDEHGLLQCVAFMKGYKAGIKCCTDVYGT